MLTRLRHPHPSRRPRRLTAATAWLLALAALLSVAFAAPAAAAPINVVPPSVSGNAAVGVTVSCTPGSWTTNAEISRNYRWVIDGRDPDPYVGDGITYEIQPADENWALQCEETVTDQTGTDFRNSSAVSVAGPAALTNLSPPIVFEATTVGDTGRCDPGAWSVAADFTYVWLRNGVPIDGATSSTYPVGDDDKGRNLACRVTATGRFVAGEQTLTSESRLIATRFGPGIRPTAPTISGVPRVGQMLTCTPALGEHNVDLFWSYADGDRARLAEGPTLIVPIAAGGRPIVCSAWIPAGGTDSAPVTIADFQLPGVGGPPLPRLGVNVDPPVLTVKQLLDGAGTLRSTRVLVGYRPPAILQNAPGGDVIMLGIEATQATQERFGLPRTGGLPNSCDSFLPLLPMLPCSADKPLPYVGVPMVRHRSMTARIFLHRFGATRTTPVEVVVTVRGPSGGVIGSVSKQGRILPADSSAGGIPPGEVSAAQRADANRSINVELPAAWLRDDRITLEAVALPRNETCSRSANCQTNNRAAVGGIPLGDTGVLKVAAVGLSMLPIPPPANRRQVNDYDLRSTVLDAARKIIPVKEIQVAAHTPIHTVDASICDAVVRIMPQLAGTESTCRSRIAMDRMLALYGSQSGWSLRGRDYDVLLGLPQTTGWVRGLGSTDPSLPQTPTALRRGPFSVIETDRQRMTVAHELGHNLGIDHVGRCAGSLDRYEEWPGGMGRLNGVGWDGTNALFDDRDDPSRPAFHDLMSYCAAGEAATWVSPRNWWRMGAALEELQKRSRSVLGRLLQEPGASARVSLVLSGGRGAVLGIAPGKADDGEPAGYELRAVGAGGELLASVPVIKPAGDVTHDEGGATYAAATLPQAALTGAVKLEVTDAGGAPIGELARPATPPAPATLQQPKAAKNGKVSVRWQPPAGSPSGLALPITAELRLSTDGGKQWRPAWQGPASAGRATLDAVPRAKNARLQLVITDGWRRSETPSKSFQTPGTPPRIDLLSPTTTATLSAGERPTLQASAFDDGGRALRGSAVRWSIDGRRVASGPATIGPLLRAGKHRVSVTATDRHGRQRTQQVRIKVRATPPSFTTLLAPEQVKKGARSVRVKLAASRPATLRVGTKRWQLGTRTRGYSLPLPRKGSELVLTLKLSDGASSSVQIAVRRPS